MHWVIIGSGNISKRHMKNVRALWPNSYITNLITHRPLKPKEEKSLFANQLIDDIDHTSLSSVNAVVICTPATDHAEQADFWLTKDIPVFIEKPLCENLENAQKLEKYNAENMPIIMVGYVLRFFPIIQKLKKIIDQGQYGKTLSIKSYVGSYLPDWRPNIDYTISVSASKNLGGGALLELSHEIDYVLWMLGIPSSLNATLENTQTLNINVEDKVDIDFSYANGIDVHVHMNFLDKPARRECIVKFEEASIKANIIEGVLEVILKNGDVEILDCKMDDSNQAYLNEIQVFYEAIRGNKNNLISLQDGINVLLIVEAARQSAEQKIRKHINENN